MRGDVLTRRVFLGFAAASLVAAGLASAGGGLAAETGPREDLTLADVDRFPECPVCGMDRRVFAHARFLTAYADGTEVGTCSLHCANWDARLTAPGRKAVRRQVGDWRTRELIEAASAVWVVGGAKSGIMTPVAKWAFGDESAARAFIAEYGGRITGFTEAAALSEAEVARLITERGLG